MEFIRACEEMALLVEEGISGLIGRPSGATFICMGADGTPTKKIDSVAEDIIIDFVTSHRLCKILISEEKGRVNIGTGKGTILLDPIDGTHNAIQGMPFYALSVAYAEGGIVKKAFVKDLAHNETFFAIRGEGAYLNGKPVHTSKTALLEESGMSIYGQKFNPETIVRLGEKIRRWRLFGASALELCYVGCGRIDGFIDIRNTLRVTDAAAGMLICEEAGGKITDHEGKPVKYSGDVREGSCLVATNATIHKKVIEYLRL